MFNFTYQKGCFVKLTRYIGALIFGFFMMVLIGGVYLAVSSGKFSSINLPNFIAGIFVFGMLSTIGLFIHLIFPPFRVETDSLVILALVFPLHIPWSEIKKIHQLPNTIYCLYLSERHVLKFSVFYFFGLLIGKKFPVIFLNISEEALTKISSHIK